MEAGGGGSGGGGGKKGGKRVPRHKQMRPTRLSMDLVDTPSADPPPVLGEMSAAQPRPPSPSPRGTHSPVGTIRVAAERCPTASPGSSKGNRGKGGGEKGSKKQQHHHHHHLHHHQHKAKPSASGSPRSPQQERRHTHPRVSSPLCTEVGVASVRSPKAAAAAAAAGGMMGGSKLANERPRGESDPELEELPLDQSGDKKPQPHEQEEEEEAPRQKQARQAGSATAAAAGTGSGAGVFQPLSPLVLPVLRSPRMRMVLSAEKLERLAQAIEGGEGQQASEDGGASCSPKPRSGSPAVVVETLKTLAKKAVAAASATVINPITGAGAGAGSGGGAGAAPTTIVAPTPIRLADSPVASTKSPTGTHPAGAVVLPPPPISPFTQVKHHHGGATVSFAPSDFNKEGQLQQPIPHITGLAGSGGGLLGAVASFPFVVGACLLACGLSQAGIEWYTTTLGSDFSTWWAGATCALLGLATMAFRRTPHLSCGGGLSRKHAGQALYGVLALGAVGAIIVALFLDLKLLDGLNKADRCGAASDNLVLDNGIVLTQTMGAACGVPTGCACVQYTTPIPGGEVTCLNFPRAAAETCASIPYGVAGLVRASIWCIAGLLFFMAVLLLRAGRVAPEERRSNKVRALRGRRSVGAGAAHGQQEQRRRRNTWHANAAGAAVVVGVEGGEESEEEEEEDVEEAIVQGSLDGAAGMDKAALARLSLHRSAQLLTPIPEYAPAYPSHGAAGQAAAAGGMEEEEEDEEEDAASVIPLRPEMATAGAARP